MYAKSGGVYVRDSSGAITGPLSTGGASDLSGCRLAGVRDDPADVIIGAFGDEIEYASNTALNAIWTAHGSALNMAAGSALAILMNAMGKGITKDASAFDSDFEVAFLVSGHEDNGGMVGIALLDGSGNGIAMSPYSDTNVYLWDIIGYQYSSTGPTGVSGFSTAWQDGRPVWWCLKKSGTTYSLRYSEDGTTWVNAHSGATRSITFTKCGWLRAYSSGNDRMMLVHRVVYGTPTISAF